MARDVNEFNRLSALGLSFPAICDILDGKRDEVLEIGMAAERAAVHKWCKGRTNIPAELTALWDLSPANFYLAFDGDAPSKHNPNDFVLIEADVAEIHGNLTYHASRAKDPWHKTYKSKSCKTAYRWLKNLPVTPPVIRRFRDQIHIDGGMHRYHLAHFYNTSRMPFLVWGDNRGEVLDIIKSGIITWPATTAPSSPVSGGNPNQATEDQCGTGI